MIGYKRCGKYIVTLQYSEAKYVRFGAYKSSCVKVLNISHNMLLVSSDYDRSFKYKLGDVSFSETGIYFYKSKWRAVIRQVWFHKLIWIWRRK